jgi:hypothetical protein
VTRSRRETLWGLVAAYAAGQDRRVSVADVCAVAVSCVQGAGAWVTAASGQGPDFVIFVSDPISEQLAELQITLGEGPSHDVLTPAAPVLGEDIEDEEAERRWPAFTAEAGRLGARAVFAFPLAVGAIRTGAMGLYRDWPGQLSRAQLGDSLLLSDAATALLLAGVRGGGGSGDADGPLLGGQAPDLAAHRAEVDQATGMLTVQLGVTAAQAYVRLRAYAYAQDRWLADVAGDIVAQPCGCTPTRRRTARHDALPASARPAQGPRLVHASDERVTPMETRLLLNTFVDLADTMISDFDVIDFLHLLTDRSVALLGASAAGVVLADPRGELSLAAASSQAAELMEVFQTQHDQGPCLDCFRTGQPVTAADLTGPDQHWTRFAAAATAAGFGSVQALPMRLRQEVIGALNLFRTGPGLLDPEELRIGQALADVANIGLLQERNVRRTTIAAEQLQAALTSRVIIEQAKGKLAERLSLDMDQAFGLLRDHARSSNQRLTDIARTFVDSPTADFPPPHPQAPARSRAEDKT